MKIAMMLALTLASFSTFAQEESPSPANVDSKPGASRPGKTDVGYGTLKISTTHRNSTGQIIWNCTYKLANAEKTVSFRQGCPNRLKFELRHR